MVSSHSWDDEIRLAAAPGAVFQAASQPLLAVLPQTCPIWDGAPGDASSLLARRRAGSRINAHPSSRCSSPASPAPNPPPEMMPPVFCAGSGPCWSLTDPVHQGELSSGVSILGQGPERVAEQLGGPSELQPRGAGKPRCLLCIGLLHT